MSDKWPYAPRSDLLIIVDDVFKDAPSRRAAELLRASGIYDKIEVVEVRQGAYHHEDLLTMLGRHPGAIGLSTFPRHGRTALLNALKEHRLVLDSMNVEPIDIAFKPLPLRLVPELRYKTILAIAAVIRGAK